MAHSDSREQPKERGQNQAALETHMGLLASLFGFDSRDPVEIELERACVARNVLGGMSQDEAQKSARELVARAKQTVRDRRQENEAPNVGDTFLQMEATNEKVRNTLQRLRAEGVTDNDIRDWWNRPPIERVLLELIDELDRGAVFIHVLKEGKSPEEAGLAVTKIHTVYGNSSPDAGEDRPIPWELRARISCYREKCWSTGYTPPEADEFASYNALVRSEMRKGLL